MGTTGAETLMYADKKIGTEWPIIPRCLQALRFTKSTMSGGSVAQGSHSGVVPSLECDKQAR